MLSRVQGVALSFLLSLPVVDVIGERFGVTFAPAPFQVEHVGTTVSERQRAREKAWAELEDTGLARADRLDAEVENALVAWYRPDVALIGRFSQTEGQRDIRYRGVTRHGMAVLSGQVGSKIAFEQDKAEYLVDGLVGYLPTVPAVRLRPVSMVEPATNQPEVDHDDVNAMDLLDPDGAPDADERRAVKQYFAWPVQRFGIFELSVRGRDDRLAQVGSVQVFDTDGGRFMVTSHTLSDGGRRREFAPTDGTELMRWLRERIAVALEDR